MAGRLDEGLRGGIKAWSQDLAWHLEVGGQARAGWLEATRRSGNAQAHLTRDEREAASSEDANQKGKRTSVKTPPTHGLDFPARVALARERRGASGAGWAKGRVGRKVGRAESEEKNF
jgi:hypothetical protein